MYVTLVHPAKTVGRNEMPFGRDTRVVPSNIVLDRVPGLHEKEIFGGGQNPQFVAMLPIAKLLWPLLLLLLLLLVIGKYYPDGMRGNTQPDGLSFRGGKKLRDCELTNLVMSTIKVT